jgi:CMP-N,N'-diacetyllegionaminic acid synthase
LKILVIIPARGGSKGIKDKNIIDVCGKPLIQYTIDKSLELKESGLIDQVIISTDSQLIADVGIKLGVKVPFLRPKNISGDKAKSIDFILHALDFFEQQNIFYDAVLLLQPTSPLRTTKLLKRAIQLMKNSMAKSLISCYREEYINDLVMYREQESSNQLIPLNENHNKGVRRQDHGDIFVRNGAVYLTRTSFLKDSNQIICDTPLLLEMKKSESTNIDSYEDLEILKRILCV